jgi:hypothetical protein
MTRHSLRSYSGHQSSSGLGGVVLDEVVPRCMERMIHRLDGKNIFEKQGKSP